MDAPLRDGQLFDLIPQRPPMVMADVFYGADETEGECGLTVRADNLFVRDGALQEPGLVEHVAQSAAAFAGYGDYVRGLAPRLGYIGEVKKFRILRLPLVGETLRTRLSVLGVAGGTTLIRAVVSSGAEMLAEGRMKIAMQE